MGHDRNIPRSVFLELCWHSVVKRLESACKLHAKLVLSKNGSEVICLLRANSRDLKFEAHRVKYRLQCNLRPDVQRDELDTVETAVSKSSSGKTKKAFNFALKHSVEAAQKQFGSKDTEEEIEEKRDETDRKRKMVQRMSASNKSSDEAAAAAGGAVGGGGGENAKSEDEMQRHERGEINRQKAACAQLLQRQMGSGWDTNFVLDPMLLMRRQHAHLTETVKRWGHRIMHALDHPIDSDVYFAPYAPYKRGDEFQPLYRRYTGQNFRTEDDVNELKRMPSHMFSQAPDLALSSEDQVVTSPSRSGNKGQRGGAPLPNVVSPKDIASGLRATNLSSYTTRGTHPPTVFRQVDRQRLILSMVNRNMNLDVMTGQGIISQCFCLHDFTQKEDLLKSNWSCKQMQIPLQIARNYFGEETTYYFAFLGMYTRWLTIPAIFGVILTLLYVSSSFVVGAAEQKLYTHAIEFVYYGYGFFLSLWSMFFLVAWKRRAARLALQWGTLRQQETAVNRPSFVGALGYNTITDEVEVQYVSHTHAHTHTHTHM